MTDESGGTQINEKTRKLDFKKETLRELSQTEAMNVQGGFLGRILDVIVGGGSSGQGSGSCGAGTCMDATCGGTGTCTIACN